MEEARIRTGVRGRGGTGLRRGDTMHQISALNSKREGENGACDGERVQPTPRFQLLSRASRSLSSEDANPASAPRRSL